MPDARGVARLLGAASAGMLLAALTGPVALAQTDEVPAPTPPAPEQRETYPPGSWGASSFEAPFDEADAVLRQATFDIEGALRYQKTGPADFIQSVEVRIVGEAPAPAEGCALPEPVTSEADRPRTEFSDEHTFLLEDVTVTCNGRYVLEAEGRLEDPDAEPHVLRQAFLLAALPESVTGLGVTLDGTERAVTATFQPLEAPTPDAIGYVLERSGPTGASFVDVASIGLDAEARIVDPLADAPAGTYTYRVRAVRAGPDGEVRSSVIHTESDAIEVKGQPSASTSVPPTSGRGAAITPRSSGGRTTVPRTGTVPRLTTPTTLDTGFEDTLDYGDPATVTDQELAGDAGDPLAGQSIVRDEAEDTMGLAIPAAGALVMLGWAGHLLYLNRLAKQL